MIMTMPATVNSGDAELLATVAEPSQQLEELWRFLLEKSHQPIPKSALPPCDQASLITQTFILAVLEQIEARLAKVVTAGLEAEGPTTVLGTVAAYVRDPLTSDEAWRAAAASVFVGMETARKDAWSSPSAAYMDGVTLSLLGFLKYLMVITWHLRQLDKLLKDAPKLLLCHLNDNSWELKFCAMAVHIVVSCDAFVTIAEEKAQQHEVPKYHDIQLQAEGTPLAFSWLLDILVGIMKSNGLVLSES